MRIFSIKIIVAIVAGLVALIALLYFQFFSQDYFYKRQQISYNINAIETAEKSLDYQVLYSGLFLYLNQDTIIKKIDLVEQTILAIENNQHLKKHHSKTLQSIREYRKAFELKRQSIFDFQTANSAIKNSTMAIPVLHKEAIEIFDNTKPDEQLFLKEFTAINSSVLLAKNSLDSQLIEYLDREIKNLSLHRFEDSNKQDICTALISNLKVFRDFFPEYKRSIEMLKTSGTQEALVKVRQNFYIEDHAELSVVQYFSYLLVALYISSLGLIIYFLVSSEKESQTDRLTRLGNRKAYEVQSSNAHQSALLLININKFKNYNDFYGISVGDKILVLTAQRLQKLTRSLEMPQLFRLGGDEFGILIKHNEKNDLETLGKSFLKQFQTESIMMIDGIKISLSISLAISTQVPLLETADMALKSIKKDRVKDFILYHHGLNLQEIVHDNITKTHELRDAIENERLIPYFQPIISIATGQIEKYEALARLITKEGEIKSIFEYLEVVKESKLYPTLTKIMVVESFAIMKKLPYRFSINLSIEDITDTNTVAMIKTMLDQNRDISQRVIFEILESEAMDDYTKVAEFIHIVKEYGCEIAIDDFGNGYSNFDHLLNLDIDIIKLDGSIIKHVDTNANAQLIIETIVGFARKAGIQTVAEYVWNEAIYDTVKSMGVDFVQGYYTGKPEKLS